MISKHQDQRPARSRRGLGWLGLLVMTCGVLLASVTTVQAAGFYLNTVGTPRSTGSAGVANVTNNTGPDAAWANPAGLVATDAPVIITGLSLIAPFAEWDAGISAAGGVEGSNTGQPAIVPSVFYAQPLSENWHFGFGLTALQGGGVDYGDNFVGRYGATNVILGGLGATWSFGYAVTDRLSLGFGGSLVYTQFEQEIAVNQGAIVPGAPDGKIEFKDLDDLGVQPIVGLQYKLTDRLMFGMTYRGEFDAELEGNVKFKNLAPAVPLPSQSKLEVDWTNPQWVETGLAWQVLGDKHLFLSGSWQEWSAFSDNTLTVDISGGTPAAVMLDRQFDDTWGAGIAFGSRHRNLSSNDKPSDRGWIFGVAYESSPVSDGKRTIDLPFDESLSLSGTYFRTRPGKWDWSVGGTVQIFGDNRLDQTAQGARFTGEFDEFVIVYLTATVRFLD